MSPETLQPDLNAKTETRKYRFVLEPDRLMVSRSQAELGLVNL